MATNPKIYRIARGDGEPARLVRAPNAAQALKHVTKDFHVVLATQDDLVQLVADGVVVEDAKQE